MLNIQFLKTIFLVLASTQIIFSQKKDMSIIDFLNIPGISSVSLSPNSSRILYILSESDWKENKQIPNLWLADLNSGISQKITFEKKGLSNPNGHQIQVDKLHLLKRRVQMMKTMNLILKQSNISAPKSGSPKNFQITELELLITWSKIQNIFIS